MGGDFKYFFSEVPISVLPTNQKESLREKINTNNRTNYYSLKSLIHTRNPLLKATLAGHLFLLPTNEQKITRKKCESTGNHYLYSADRLLDVLKRIFVRFFLSALFVWRNYLLVSDLGVIKSKTEMYRRRGAEQIHLWLLHTYPWMS